MFVAAFATLDGRDVLSRIERETIRQALELCGWNVTRAAASLGLHRQALQRKIRDYGITREVA